MSNPTRERIGTVVDANGTALTVNRDMALTEIVLEAMTPAGPVALVFYACRGRNADVMRMLMGQPPRGLTVL